MASLFIKDPETAALAGKVAAQLGTTKTEAVRRGLTSLETAGISEAPNGGAVTVRTVDWLRQYRAQHPLPDREAMKIDKAFYDSLSDEEDVVDPWSE
ncbi:type II toxin-antitoxin system VapB family antitoxin [Sphingomonas sp. CV7422]|uniref:type II toxin-antitoxin system VapB family antitoxin n=1 Tax=Sphingomonas sp. CV7422 TaxID=3018036 RepID=UPI0022FE7E04|nr:type II toxin-antitoxin system VapB family antitoxin [Sphingomonas sp. CV7422]